MAFWPTTLDIPKDDCSRILRRMELQTYGSCISVLRAQGPLTKEKRLAIETLRKIFHIKTERHKAEVRRAVNDELLNTIALKLYGANTELDWAVEGRRLVPLVKRLDPITAYTPLANEVAEMTHIINASLPPPRDPSRSPTPETDDAEETMEELEMAPPPPPLPPPPPVVAPPVVAPVKVVQTLLPTPIAAVTQPPIQLATKTEKAAGRKRRVSSFESTTQNIPPPSKIPYIPPSSTASRTVSISAGLSSSATRMPNIPTAIRPNTAMLSPAPKVLVVSSSASSTTPSLLQRSLSVPMVKTVKSVGAGLMSTTVSSGPNAYQGSLGTPLLSAPKIRPKTLAPSTMLPKGRGGSIVIPLAPNLPGPSGVQLRPPTVVQTKPTLQPVQVKQDASGVKVISGSHKITPKPPTVTVSSGSSRVVSIASAPRISPVVTSNPPVIVSATMTTHAATPTSSAGSAPKPLTLNFPSTPNVQQKQNVILVKKGGSSGFSSMPSQGNISLGGPGRVLIQGTPNPPGNKLTVAGDTASSLAQALNLPHGSRQGNVFVLDLSQEQISKSSTLSDLLHKSGILTKASTSKEAAEEPLLTREVPNTTCEPKALLKEATPKTVLSPSSKLKTKILRAVPTRTKSQEPSEYSIKLVSGRASVESSTPQVVQAKVVREIASKATEPRTIKFDDVAKEVAPKKLLPMKELPKIEVKLHPATRMVPDLKQLGILPDSEKIMVNLIDQVIESSISVETTPSTAAGNALQKASPHEDALNEFLTFKKSESEDASKKVLAMLQEDPVAIENADLVSGLPELDSTVEIEAIVQSELEEKI
ncbi:BRCA2-interacting transcriptional repressor EMSY isoform X2 [Neocloeon triangulifer]|uniref:BRCA2-interacting transcriptional repressor EMSY isoform X2 n=1 Tax=Neocloeon triangulifer TaxID=2078957 RepID=UPI00286FA94A|nr:BRCA2-interacting transcriptional repressor EMSY isoform X2 [Neocloeon triangulifer]